MDSIAIAWWKRPAWAVTIDYGQRAAAAEYAAASEICRHIGIKHEFIQVDCGSLGSGDMAGTAADSNANTSDWWPYRNQLIITLASMRAVSRGVTTLYIGTVKSDGESHLDGTAQFISHVDHLMSYQEGHLRIEAPAIDFSTAQLVRHAGIPANLLAWSHSCHRADIACGDCRGCYKYLDCYRELGAEYSGG